MPDFLLLASIAGALGMGMLAGWAWAQKRFRSERERWEQTLQRSIEEGRTDALTGLWNRRAFDEQLAIQIAVADRYGVPCALVLIDLDELKSVNDRGGHGAGDAALRQFAALLKSRLRAADLAARIGGDEFALILPQTDLAGARNVAGRVLEQTRARQDNTGSSPVPLVFSVSLGVAGHRQHESTSDLARRADRALYLAKQAGGNRISFAGDDAPSDQRSIDKSSL